MKRILVLQTTRMGDVLQTSPLVHRLREKYPDAHIAVMVRRMGKTIAERNPDVDEVIVYDEDESFINLRAKDSDRLLQAYQSADALIDRLRASRFDVAYNCAHSIASAMLLKLGEIPEVVGADLAEDWHFVLRGRWSNYFFTSVFHREYNDLNLCDITRHFVAGDAPSRLIFEVLPEDRQFATNLLEQNRVSPHDFIACFQLGASEENKRWSERHFAALARMLHEQRRAKIFLVGVKEEEVLSSVFDQDAPGRAIPLYGRTTIPQLAALLERANVLVTNDTGTMHIAAAVNCPVLLVSVGYVHFRETGPYGEGHCAVEWRRGNLGRADNVPGGLGERDLVRPEHVIKAIDYFLEVARFFQKRGSTNTKEPVPELPLTPDLADIEINISRFAPDGCLEWYPALRRPLAARDILRMAYRAMWLEHLNGQLNKEAEEESIRIMLSHFEAPAELPDAWREELFALFLHLADLAQQGIDETEQLMRHLSKPGGVRQAQQSVHRLMALDEDMRVFSELSPACKPLILIARYERENLEGADPVALAQATLQIYTDCRLRASLMKEKLARLFLAINPNAAVL